MECKYMGKCPLASGWCYGKPNHYKTCIPQLLAAYECAQRELQEYKDTGLTPKQIYEIDRLYAEQATELARYKEIGSGFGISPDMVKAAHQMANVNIGEGG